MLAIDISNEPPQPALVMVAQASQTQQVHAIADRNIGVCSAIENSKSPSGIHGSSLSPFIAAQNYFHSVEQKAVKVVGKGKLSVLQNPAHGKLTPDGADDYEYIPTLEFYGSDQATLLITMDDGAKLKLVYLFYVEANLDDEDYQRLCPSQRMYKKIAFVLDTNEANPKPRPPRPGAVGSFR
jgi:hypothetical protein